MRSETTQKGAILLKEYGFEIHKPILKLYRTSFVGIAGPLEGSAHS